MRSALIVAAITLIGASYGGGSGLTSHSSMSASASAATAPTASTPPSNPGQSPPPPTPSPTPPPPPPPPPSTPGTPPPSPPSAPATYKIVEIPRPTTAGSMRANGVNAQGIVVGEYESICTPDCGGNPQAWMYQQSSGSLSELTFDPAETGASANGISDGGLIAGEEISLQRGLEAGYWTVTGGAVVLGGQWQGYDWAVAVNDRGTIIGDLGADGTTGQQALMWAAPGYAETSLPPLTCDSCVRADVLVNAINAGGAAVGHSAYAIGMDTAESVLAVEWTTGGVTTLVSAEDSGASDAYGINSRGDVVGALRVGSAAGAPTHAFLIHDGRRTDLGTLPGDVNSSAVSINNAGQIVGTSDDGNTSRPFLYRRGHIYDLNALIDPTDPLIGQVTLQAAASISSRGWIVINGTDSRDTGANADTTRAFLLIPLAERWRRGRGRRADSRREPGMARRALAANSRREGRARLRPRAR
jgi:probable HAF family extracellular repeat protein